MTAKTPAQLTDQAAETVRQLNHATRSPGDDWQYPGDAYSVTGNLAHMTGMLPQAIAQTRSLIARLDAEGRLRSDKDTLDADLAAAYAGLEVAAAAAQTLYQALSRAQNGLSPIAYRD